MRDSNNPEEYNIDAITRLISTCIAIINPHAFIFCDDEVNQFVIDQIVKSCPQYIPAEHIPKNNSKRLGRRLFIWIKKPWT